MEDKYIERETEQIECIGCINHFNDDDITDIFGEPLCDDCIDYLLKNNVNYLIDLLQRINKVNKYDVIYLFERLDKINKERN